MYADPVFTESSANNEESIVNHTVQSHYTLVGVISGSSIATSRNTCVTRGSVNPVYSQQHRFPTKRKNEVFVPTLGSTTAAGI